MNSEQTFTELPDHLRPWLFDPGSLTRSVQLACQQVCDQSAGDKGFHMRVLSESECVPHADESNLLGLQLGESAIVREVHLKCSEQAWVYARSVIPLLTATQDQEYLKRMGDKPLGAALFADSSMQRGDIELVTLAPNDRVADGQVVEEACLWGRRSIFKVGGKPLLVAEYFLPAIPVHPEAVL